MSVRLSDDEAWRVVESSHTGILTTLRSDGAAVALPVWFVVLDRTVCLGTPRDAGKVTRVGRDPRASFLVESGTKWAELRGVHLSGRVEIVTDDALTRSIAHALEGKYEQFRSPLESLPAATRAHYDTRTFLRMHPQGSILSWDNARIRLRAADTEAPPIGSLDTLSERSTVE